MESLRNGISECKEAYNCNVAEQANTKNTRVTGGHETDESMGTLLVPELYSCMGTKPGWRLALYRADRCASPGGEKLPDLRQQPVYGLGKAFARLSEHERGILSSREAHIPVRLSRSGILKDEGGPHDIRATGLYTTVSGSPWYSPRCAYRTYRRPSAHHSKGQRLRRQSSALPCPQ